MEKLLFGVSGLPLGKGDGKRKFAYATGIEHLASIGLDAMELLFVRSVNVGPGNCAEILAASRRHGVFLSAHGSYYVNLNGDADTRTKSLARIRAAAEAVRLVGGAKVVFHPGFYLGQDSASAQANVSAALAELADAGAAFCLETTGKPTQFGTVEEIVSLCRVHPHCRPCIDFAHVHARGGGALKGYDDFAAILEHIGRELGRAALDDLHMHAGGIEYTARGERNHLPLAESDFDYKAMLKALKDFDVKGCVVCEGPRVEHDALVLKRAYGQL